MFDLPGSHPVPSDGQIRRRRRIALHCGCGKWIEIGSFHSQTIQRCHNEMLVMINEWMCLFSIYLPIRRYGRLLQTVLWYMNFTPIFNRSSGAEHAVRDENLVCSCKTKHHHDVYYFNWFSKFWRVLFETVLFDCSITCRFIQLNLVSIPHFFCLNLITRSSSELVST